MADQSDVSTFGNFSIQDTMEMGMGNRELIEDFLSPETSTAAPDEVTVIDKNSPKKVEKTAPKKEEPKKVESKKEEDKEEDKPDPLTSFLGDEEDAPDAKDVADKTEEGDGKEGEPENRFAALSKDLFKLGVFSKDEEEDDIEITTPEQFLDRFNLEKKKGAIEVVDKFIGQFGEDYQNAFEAIFVKGVNPKDYFGTYNNIQNFATLDLKVEDNQKAVIRQALSDQGLESEDITTEIERLTGYGDLEAVAQRHHKALVKKEAAKLAQLEKDSELKLQQQAAIKNQYLTNVNTVLQNKLKAKEFDGIPLNPKLAQELQDFLVTDKYKTPSGETLTEFDRTILDLKRPENHEKKVKLALLLKILEKDPTLSTIQKSGVTKQSDALFGELARQSGKSSVKAEKATTSKPSSWFQS